MMCFHIGCLCVLVTIQFQFLFLTDNVMMNILSLTQVGNVISVVILVSPENVCRHVLFRNALVGKLHSTSSGVTA